MEIVHYSEQLYSIVSCFQEHEKKVDLWELNYEIETKERDKK